MNNYSLRLSKQWLTLCILLSFFSFLSSCDKDEEVVGAPSITDVRDASGVITHGSKGEGIEIAGKNLATTQSVSFNGVEANLSTATISDESILLTIPNSAPTIADQEVTDELKVVTAGGDATHSFIILPPEPTITSLSNSAPSVGETITISGTNFYYVQSVDFPGSQGDIQVTDMTVANDGQSLSVAVPEGYDPAEGRINVVTLSGTASIQPDSPNEPLQITELQEHQTESTWTVQENIQLGDKFYTDRDGITVDHLPDFFAGSDWIRTAVDSKAYTGDGTLASFKINREADVYVAIIRGIQPIPAWLNSWEAVPEYNPESDVTGYEYLGFNNDVFHFYKKTFPAGIVELGQNGHNVRATYTAIVK